MDMFENWLNTPLQQQSMMPMDTAPAMQGLQGSIAASPAEMRGYTAPAQTGLQGGYSTPAVHQQSDSSLLAPPQPQPAHPDDSGRAAEAQAARAHYANYQKRLAGYQQQAENYS